MPRSRTTATTCDANASLNSISSTSSIESPARLSAFGTALIGAIPITSGSTPAVANVMNRASGLRLSCAARSLLMSRIAAAPSE
jgi:hypothetical protein